MRKIIFIFFIFRAFFLNAQELTQTIRGTVVDKQTQSTLYGAVVQVLAIDGKNALTDENGKFRIENVPIGRRQVKISLLSYKERVYTLNLTTGKEIVLNAELEESVIEGQEIVVIAETDKTKTNNKNATVSSRGFTIEETSRYAGSRNDPARMAANFAGVSGANDSRNDIIIRGNSPLGVLWRLNGMDIPNPNHFGSMGSTGGPVSILNNNTLDNSDFLTSAFPADYGNAIAGVFDLKMRAGNNEKHEFLTQFGFNGFELAAEGPFSKKKKGASFLIDYRYSTLGIFKALGISFGAGAAVPQYQDLTINITVPTAKAGKFTFYGIGGLSYVALLDKDRDKKADIFGYKGIDTYFRSNVGVAGANHTFILNSSSYLRTNVGVSGQYNGIIADNVLFDSTGVPTGKTSPNYHSTTSTIKYSVNFVYNKKFNAKDFITTGVYLDDFVTKLADSTKSERDTLPYHVLRSFNGSAVLAQAFINWQHKFTDKLTLNTGFRYVHFLLNNTFNPEPRAGLRWSFTQRQSLSLGAGLHSQVQPMYIYFSSTYDPLTRQSEKTNVDLGLTKSAHGVIAYDVNIGKNARIKAEAYYQYLYNVPVKYSQPSFSVLNLGANFESPNVDSLVNKGTGENCGVEFTLEKFYSKGYYYLFTTSLFQSYYYGSDHIKRNTAFNGNYVFNLLGGKEFKINNRHTLALDVKLTYAGGKHFTNVNLTASQAAGEEVRDYANAYANQYPAYFRLDIKPSYRYNMKKVTMELNCDFQNVTRHDNVFQQVYDPTQKKIVTDYQLKFFFIPQFRLLF